MREPERRDQDGQQPWVEQSEGADRDPEAGQHELDRETARREEAALAEAVTAPESEHRRQQNVVDRDEGHRRRKACECEAGIAVERHRVGREPRCERAQQVVGDVEKPDVPGGSGCGSIATRPSRP
ncbi:MAG: hypothetical protein ABIR67_08025 [Gaiellaceae bacterium]